MPDQITTRDRRIQTPTTPSFEGPVRLAPWVVEQSVRTPALDIWPSRITCTSSEIIQ